MKKTDKKTDKKIDQAICSKLTRLCEEQLKKIKGFEWITHHVNYKQFPHSLRVICIFNSVTDAAVVDQDALRSAIQKQLMYIDIHITPVQISFDSEEQCEREHAGNWKKRLQL